MIGYSEAKSILESVSELVKKAATIDLQEKIMELREYIVSLKDENISIKEENQRLKLELDAEQTFSLREGLYWKEGDEIPFCQKCLDGSKQRVHLQIWGDGWKCFECKSVYQPPSQAGRVQIFRPDWNDR